MEDCFVALVQNRGDVFQSYVFLEELGESPLLGCRLDDSRIVGVEHQQITEHSGHVSKEHHLFFAVGFRQRLYFCAKF